MSAEQRLRAYNPDFSTETLDVVCEVADRQVRYEHYSEFFEELGINAGVAKRDGILDIRPDEHDPQEALLYFLPMANPLDPNQIYQVGTIAATNPNTRVIALGNPSAPGYDAGELNHAQRKRVRNGSFLPIIAPVFRHLEQANITKATHVGYSLGVDLATCASNWANHEVKNAVLIEPVRVIKRSLPELTFAFMSTNQALKKYVNATETPSFLDARNDSVKTGYILGLGRLTNLAIAKAMTTDSFKESLASALHSHPETKTTVIWGSESELAVDGVVMEIVRSLRRLRTYDVSGLRLAGQKHALANDIHLQAALVHEALQA